MCSPCGMRLLRPGIRIFFILCRFRFVRSAASGRHDLYRHVSCRSLVRGLPVRGGLYSSVSVRIRFSSASTRFDSSGRFLYTAEARWNCNPGRAGSPCGPRRRGCSCPRRTSSRCVRGRPPSRGRRCPPAPARKQLRPTREVPAMPVWADDTVFSPTCTLWPICMRGCRASRRGG